MTPSPDTNSLTRALDDEFRRVAKLEDKPLHDLVKEVAGLLGISERQLYNYRSNKWPLPSSLIAPLCQRFGSRLLLDVIATAIPIEISPLIHVDAAWNLSKQLIRRVIDHSEIVQRALGVEAAFTRSDLITFSELTDSIKRDCGRLYSFVEAAYEDRRERKVS